MPIATFGQHSVHHPVEKSATGPLPSTPTSDKQVASLCVKTVKRLLSIKSSRRDVLMVVTQLKGLRGQGRGRATKEKWDWFSQYVGSTVNWLHPQSAACVGQL